MTARVGAWALGVLLAAAPGCGNAYIDNPRFARDRYLAVSLAVAIADLANQNLDGRPVGDVDLNTICPAGGSVRIHGELAQAGGDSSYDVVYELTGCAFSGDYGDYRVDADAYGQLAVSGARNNLSGYGSEQMDSPALRLTGTMVTPGHVDDFDDTCPFDFNLVSTEISDAFYGDWCGRPFAESMSHRG